MILCMYNGFIMIYVEFLRSYPESVRNKVLFLNIIGDIGYTQVFWINSLIPLRYKKKKTKDYKLLLYHINNFINNFIL